jgi:hypothetical protein
VNALNLHIKQPLISEIYVNIAVLLNPLGQFSLVLHLNCSPLALKLLVFRELFQLPQLIHVQNPLIAANLAGI